MAGVVQPPHGQLLQRQDALTRSPYGLHLSREEHGQLPRGKRKQLHFGDVERGTAAGDDTHHRGMSDA